MDINALFYFPERHMEKFGMGRQDPGVSLYCRKVLIQPKSKTILPVWLRFVKGVVDSEDIPLNIRFTFLHSDTILVFDADPSVSPLTPPTQSPFNPPPS